MGFGRKSTAQLQKHIRTLALDSSCVVLTTHAKRRMKERKVLMDEVLSCLKSGTLHRQPEPDMKTGCLICQMAHFLAGRNIAVSVALDDADPALVVVTVIDKDR